MLKFIVPSEERERRLAICHKCRFYNSTTQSCGTLIVGRRLKPEELLEAERENIRKHNKKRVRLCGCFLPAKTWGKLESCPIGRWEIYGLTDVELAALLQFVEEMPRFGIIKGEALAELNRWYAKLTGVKTPLSNCPPCVRQTMVNLRHAVEEYKKGLEGATATDATA